MRFLWWTKISVFVLCCLFRAQSGDAKKRRRRVREGRDGKRRGGGRQAPTCCSDRSQRHVYDNDNVDGVDGVDDYIMVGPPLLLLQWGYIPEKHRIQSLALNSARVPPPAEAAASDADCQRYTLAADSYLLQQDESPR